MRLSTYGLLAAGGLLLAPAPPALAQASAVAATRTAQPLARALADLNRVYGTQFVFEERLLAGKTTSVQVVRGRAVEDLLKAMLYPNGLLFLYIDKNHYTIVAKDVRAEASPAAPAGAAPDDATRVLSGYVQDDKGTPCPAPPCWPAPAAGVGVATNADGRFNLSVPGGTLALNVSSIGYESQVVPVTATNFYAITLKPQAQGLAEVQVVSNGYSELPRERATGAFGVVTSEQLEQIPTPNVIQRLEGQVAGVQLNLQSSDNTFLYENSRVNPIANNVGTNSYGLTVRGISTLNGDTKPLIVVDGLPTELDLRTLNPDDIAQITVLKDAAAASIWGVRAANGVVVVQTKKGRFNRAPTLSFSTSFIQAGQPRLNALRLLDAAQAINYEQELVDRSLVVDPGLPPANPNAFLLSAPRVGGAGVDVSGAARHGYRDPARLGAGRAGRPGPHWLRPGEPVPAAAGQLAELRPVAERRRGQQHVFCVGLLRPRKAQHHRQRRLALYAHGQPGVQALQPRHAHGQCAGLVLYPAPGQHRPRRPGHQRE